MNPRSDSQSVSGTAPLPTHTHELTKAELLELGTLAVEEPHPDAATVAPMGVPATSPLPPTAVVTPQQPALAPDGTAVQTPQATVKPGVEQPVSSQAAATRPVATEPAAPPSAGSVSEAAPTPPQTPDSKQIAAQPQPNTAPEPPAPPAVLAPKTTPSKARDIAAPAPAAPLIPPEADAPAEQPAQPSQLVSADRMELSANSMNLKSISRLRTVGIVMNITVIMLIAGVVAGGWYIYTYVLKAGGTALF